MVAVFGEKQAFAESFETASLEPVYLTLVLLGWVYFVTQMAGPESVQDSVDIHRLQQLSEKE